MQDFGHWDISIIGEFDPDDFFGFIYEIEEIDTSRLYIGRKQFRNRNKRVWKESNWREYVSSSDSLCELIETRGKEFFKFRILSLCSGKAQLTYDEERLQYQKNVLFEKLEDGTKKYFNKCIGHKHFAGVEKQSAETLRRMSLAQKGHSVSQETREKLRLKNLGVKKSYKPRPKGKGRKQSPEHIEKRTKLIRGLSNKKLKGRPIPDSQKEKIKESLLGKPHTEERKNNQSKAGKLRPKGSCLYCKKEMDICNLLQWHGENCKMKPI